MKNTIELGHMIKELRPGEALTFEIPQSFLTQNLDSEAFHITVRHEMKRGRSCRLVIQAPKAVVISKP